MLRGLRRASVAVGPAPQRCSRMPLGWLRPHTRPVLMGTAPAPGPMRASMTFLLAVRAASQVCLWQVGDERHDAHCDGSGAAVGGALRGKEVRGLVRRGGGSFAPY